MKWSPQQDYALREAAKFLRDPDRQLFRLFGYAGTGKTTLAQHLASGLDGSTQYCAYTGKAASVLQSRGCSNAATIHSLIYHSKEKGKKALVEHEKQLELLSAELKEEGLSPKEIEAHKKVKDLKKLIKDETESLKKPAFVLNSDSSIKTNNLVIVDECSMVDERMALDLMSFGVKIIVLGDPAQLPPVKGGGYFTDAKPDIMLEEIHRQAEDNPIIHMSMRIRKGMGLDLGNYGSSRVITRDQVVTADALWADIIICGKNATRHGCNRRMRALHGRGDSPLPIAGDTVLCRRNNRDLGILNGEMFRVIYAGDVMDNKIALRIAPMDRPDHRIDVSCHVHYFVGQEPAWYEQKDAEKFEFGYGITAHVSQGSQWEKVYIFDESSIFKQNRDRWLYTAVTRASEEVLIVR